MTYFTLTAELQSPLFIQENRQSNAAKGLRYLPGSSLRGAFAANYLRQGGTPDDMAFKKIFLDSPVQFPNMLPSVLPDNISKPLPLTAHSCKRNGGFKTQDGHGVTDALAAYVAAEIEEKPVKDVFQCQVCHQDMKPMSGFWNNQVESPAASEPVKIYQRHTGIDRLTGTVAPSIYYITQGVAESVKQIDGTYNSQFLTGGIYLDDEQIAILSDWCNNSIFAGADRTRGMGEMLVELKETDNPGFTLIEWDNAFRQKIGSFTSRPIPCGIYVSICLTSHAIFVDRFLRPSPELVMSFPDMEPVLRIIHDRPIFGWQTSWGLPKPVDIGIDMGSVYLFQYHGDTIDDLENFLTQLIRQGVGLRKPEGFGQIQVCDPLHIQEVI
jgi:CRISPR-associated protein Csx10